MIWSLTEKKYVSAIATSADIIIKLFLFFTKSFRNPSFIFYIGIDTRYSFYFSVKSCVPECVIIQIVAIVPLESLLSVVWIHFVSKVGVWRRRNGICPTRYIVAMYVHIHFNHVTKARSLSMTIDIKDRYLFLPTCYCIKPQRTEGEALPLSLCTTTHHDDDHLRSEPFFEHREAILWAQKPFCEVVTTAP